MQDAHILIVAAGLCVGLLHALGTDVLTVDADDVKESCDVKSAFHCDDGGIECINGTRKCDGLPQCSTGRDESVEMCGCLSTEFQCNNTHCIEKVRRCDLHVDCLNEADEKGCETFECPMTHFKCANHKCVPRDKTCDFEDDCGDGSDEKMCKRRSCGFGYFNCSNGECTLSARLCDGVKNCKDGSDEIQELCDKHYKCPTGFHIDMSSKCDGWVDCKITGQDESDCGECKTNQFRCPNGQCIGQTAVCDQVCDCTGCEDELSCAEDLMYCPTDTHYVCKSTLRCIPHDHLCDGVNDCWDSNVGQDEYFCHNETNCSSKTYRGKPTLWCPEGRCLPLKARCNRFSECKGGEDEDDCEYPSCSGVEFQCSNSRCVTLTSRCDGINDCWDWSDETGCADHPCPEGSKRCTSGQCVPEYKWCNHWPNCPDGSDEVDCEYRQCGEDEFTCDNGECIPESLVCYNGRNQTDRDGCQDRSHLIHCDDYQCRPGTFKCRKSFCVDEDQKCDGSLDCFINASDEENCPYLCPYDIKVCSCFDTTMTCKNLGLTTLPHFFKNEHISELHWSGNLLAASLTSESFNESRFDAITSLDLSHNGMTNVPRNLFGYLWRLTHLNLANNSITRLHNGSLTGLKNLRQLFLHGNGIQVIAKGVFMDLGMLPTLDLSFQNLSKLDVNTFRGMRSLKLLNLSGNQLSYLQNGVFNGLGELLTLDISQNVLVLIHTNVFYSLPSLNLLHTDEFRFCCQAKSVSECHPAGDAFSSCEDLMSNTILRLCIWILGMTAFLGNGMVIVWRARNPRASKVHSFLITNLAVGDLVMGVYMVIIAAVDAYYRGVYILHDEDWRRSPLCHLAGFFSMFSSELSVLTLTVITLDRLMCIIFPLRVRRLGVKGAVGAMAFVWLIVFIIAFIPLSGIPSFGNFYGRSGVCLALPLTPERPPGWEYSVAVVLVLNLLSLLVIALAYVWMFLVARKTRTADLVCWTPIIFLGLASMGGLHVSNQVYAWIAVFILPINSAINPVLYTISTAPFIGHVTNRARWFRKSFINSFNADTKHSFVDDRTVHSYTTDRRSSPRKGETILYSAKRDRRASPRNGETMPLKNLRVTVPEYSRRSSSDV